MSRTAILGQGYVGLPLAMRAAEVGHQVIGYDIDAERIRSLASGQSFVEDISDERLEAVLGDGRYRPSLDPGDLEGFEVAVITVPTPQLDGVPDLSHVQSAAAVLAPYVTRDSTVILESTTYPGTTTELVGAILQNASGLTPGEDFNLGYSPERIDPGNLTWTLERTPKVVSGVNARSLAAVDAFYSVLVDETVPVSSTAVAELTKLIENTFRHVNIALVNELAVFASALNLDIWEALAAAGTKPHGFMTFMPGPGVGGHCLPIDPSYLSWESRRSLGKSFRFVELANEINDDMPRYVVERLSRLLNDQGRALSQSTVLLLGLAYKRNSSDFRQAPSLKIAAMLAAQGAEVLVCDPLVRQSAGAPDDVNWVDSDPATLGRADIVVLVTDHDLFDYEVIEAGAKLIFDTRGRLGGPNVVRL